MPILDVADAADARLAPFRDVKDPRWLRERACFLAEGRRVVAVLARAPAYRVSALLATEAALAALPETLAALPDATPVLRVSPALMALVAGVRFHQGCVAAGECPRLPSVEELLALPGLRRLVVLEQVSDPDNVGGIFRSAFAFGVGAVLLAPGCASPLYRKASRTSMGASFRIPFAELAAWPEGLDALRDRGFELLALTPGRDATPVDAFGAERPLPERAALLFGSEGPGLSPGALERAHECVRIPMESEADSLNVSAAAAVALHRLCGGSR